MHSTPQEKVGLAYWMNRVLEEHSKVDEELATDPVHDLRVALRRCILIADVMRNVDPGSDWKAMRKAGRGIFQRLGALRDTQVLRKWIEKLSSSDDPARSLLLESLKAKHEIDRAEAQGAVKEFDRKQWKAWTRELSNHYRHVTADRAACESLLLEMLETSMDLHRRARRNQSNIAYHRLRVGLKKFRYGIENFLPGMYPIWAPGLKSLQDMLGEIHDLSALDQMIVKDKRLSHEAVRVAWREKLEAERLARLEQYRAKVTGKSSLFVTWREGLPTEKESREAGLSRLSEWAYFLTPDFRRSRRVARLSLELYDGFARRGLIARDANGDERSILQAAALLQEVGHSKRGKAHHKKSYRMIRRISPPVGWSNRDLELTALIARFHCGALPRPDHKILQAYEFKVRQAVILLASLLRFANALQAKPYRAIRHLEVDDCSGVIVVRSEGFPERDPHEPKLAAARRLMEFAWQRPVHILAPETRVMAPRLVRSATHSDAA